MACVVSETGVLTAVPEPNGGWTLDEVSRHIHPSPVVKTLKTVAGEYRFVTSKEATWVNIPASLEARLLLRGIVLVIPPTETMIRSQS